MDRNRVSELLRLGKDSLSLPQRVRLIWRTLDASVPCVLHLASYGADIRIAHPSTEISTMEVIYGLIPDLEITETLPQLMAEDKAPNLTFSGKKIMPRRLTESD